MGVCSCKASGENGVNLAVKDSGHFRVPFPEERGTAELHQRCHGVLHGDFHGRFQEKIPFHKTQVLS